jgi:hypothetical protein
MCRIGRQVSHYSFCSFLPQLLGPLNLQKLTCFDISTLFEGVSEWINSVICQEKVKVKDGCTRLLSRLIGYERDMRVYMVEGSER